MPDETQGNAELPDFFNEDAAGFTPAPDPPPSEPAAPPPAPVRKPPSGVRRPPTAKVGTAKVGTSKLRPAGAPSAPKPRPAVSPARPARQGSKAAKYTLLTVIVLFVGLIAAGFFMKDQGGHNVWQRLLAAALPKTAPPA